MMVRVGFVANSSSSSFVLLVKYDKFLGVLQTLHPAIQAAMKQITTKKDVLGLPCAVYHDLEVQDYSYLLENFVFEYQEDMPEEYEECGIVYHAMEEFNEAMKEQLTECDYFKAEIILG